MVVPQQNRGILLSFPMGESVLPRPKSDSCSECKRLDVAYEAVITEINAIVRGPFPTVGEKMTRLFQKQDERDKILAQLYWHKHKVHSRNTT